MRKNVNPILLRPVLGIAIAIDSVGFPGGSEDKESACNAGDPGSIPGLGRCPGEGNGNPSGILAWRIPWTEEPGGLQSMGLQESDTTQQLNYCFYALVRVLSLGISGSRT